MALFNEILVGRLNRWVQKFYAIKSGTASLTQLLPTVQTVNIVQSGVEDRYLQGWARYMFTATQAAVAAANSIVQLRNPTTSGVVAVIEKLNIMPGAASLTQVQIINQQTDAATLLTMTANRIDRRTNPAPSCIPSSGSVGAPGAIGQAIFRMSLALNSNAEFIAHADQELTILPGDTCVALCELVNTQVSVAFMWRERPLESSELT